jgi:hypothetical protein
MFDRDTADIRRFVGVGSREWENRAASVAVAVVFTIRTQTNVVADQLLSFATGDQRYVYMSRGDIVAAIRDNLHVPIFRRVRAAMVVGDTAGALLALTELPGLGLVKAGFVIQMIWQSVGCLDTRNIKEFGLDVSRFNLTKSHLSDTVKRERAEEYIAECERLGGAEYLWDNWCRGAAVTYRKRYQSGDEVSREHVAWVRLANHGLWDIIS